MLFRRTAFDAMVFCEAGEQLHLSSYDELANAATLLLPTHQKVNEGLPSPISDTLCISALREKVRFV